MKELDRGDRVYSVMDEEASYTAAYKKKGIVLYGYTEIPHFLRGNPFIFGGYRAYLSSSLCFKSLFLWSNETINIWSHLLGFLFFMIVTIYDNLVIIPLFGGTYLDHVIYTIFLSCFMSCMIFSAGFHLFCCHSEVVCKWWFGMDLAGISVGLLGCYFPAVYYAFYCFETWRNVYLLIVSCLTLTSFFMQMHPSFLRSTWATRRLLLFCGMVAFGILPIIHWIYLYGGWNVQIVQEFYPKITVMYTLGILALLFYATKMPERCLPGKVDFLGSSHQMWHLLVVVAFFWWHQSGIQLMEYRYKVPCSSETT